MHDARIRPTGFTLLELLVVLVILGLLAAYVGPRYFGQLGKAESKTAQTQVVAFGKALDAFRLDVGRYPSSSEGLLALYQKPEQLSSWFGPYLDKPPPLDPWGKAYEYRSPGQHGDYDLFSLGKDGIPGGSAENADITSWVTSQSMK
ncbi:MAG: type II secretion system major pseudopilin GspG [Limnobacter sp.]|uniref:type II secretion system major pseudopilin GspG n=1 Tax=Limnobacter sp. TaxID=2003368 RepID=UPI00391C007F